MTEGAREHRTPDQLLDELSQPSVLGARPGLERVSALLAALGNPQAGLPVIHIGGTSGKGSTATMVAAILSAAGLRVGLHAKPHLRSVEERLVVAGQPISAPALVSLLEEIAPVARAVRPSWHELTTALMLAHFSRSRVDVAVVEVGLGGTYDSTNVVQPIVAVLTNVGLDHTEVLGDTVEKIARDKVGIFKAGAPVIAGVKQPSVVEIVQRRADSVGSTVKLLGREVVCRLVESDSSGSTFDLRVGYRCLPGLRLAMAGWHQVENASLAVAAALAIEDRGFVVTDSAVRRGLSVARVPGRIEVVRRDPIVLLDGAHNPDKMSALAAALADNFRWRRLVGVLSFKKGHDHQSTISRIAPMLDEVWLTRYAAATDFGHDTSQDPVALAAMWRSLAPLARIHVVDDPKHAVAAALAQAATDDLIVITGSLYLVGHLRDWLLDGGDSAHPL